MAVSVLCESFHTSRILLKRVLHRRWVRVAAVWILITLLIVQCSFTAVLLQVRRAGGAHVTAYFNNYNTNITDRYVLNARTIRASVRNSNSLSPENRAESSMWNMLFGQTVTTESPPPTELCPDPPDGLEGHVDVTYERLSWRELERLYPDVAAGGTWRPPGCVSRHHVAIIVPYRDRSDHLRVFLHHIHPFLQRQLVHYTIYVVEQDPYSPFNRGLLLNIGFKEAMSEQNYSCAIFHDVDLLPENDHNLYYCPDQPRHMSAAVDEFAYRLPYDNLFGGIEAFSRHHFQLINGFSNKYFGWGAEDDDLYQRIIWHGLNLTRYPMNVARYSMIRHMKNEPNPSRLNYLKTNAENHLLDGLNTLKYDRRKFVRRKLFTWVYVRVNQTAIMQEAG